MKKILSVCIVCGLLLCALAGCGKPAVPAEDNGKLKIVCTIFPIYDWVREILGDRLDDAEVTLLLDSGVDLHSYEPLPEDLLALAACDLFIYVGGESDEKWAPGTIESTGVKASLNLLEALGDAAKEEEDVEGMQEEEHDHEEGEEHEEHEMDEHIWLSLKNAAILCAAICDRICAADEKNAETYRANAAAYTEKLNDLDARFAAAVDTAKFKAVVVADRYPFRYLFDDYGITPYAAFSGCSTESQASMGTIVALAEKLDALGLNAVAVTESSSGSIADAVLSASKNADRTVVTLDSLQSVTESKVNEGAKYLTVMEQNLSALITALN